MPHLRTTGSNIAIAALSVLFALEPCWSQDTTKTRGVVDVSNGTPAVPAQPASFNALVIGNNDYRSLHKLETAVHDAESVAEVLERDFGFKVKFLPNATRNDILSALNQIRRTLTENSNLLIYYAGHGYEDPENHEAYWMPVDASSDDNVNWISAGDITADLRAIPSRHILIISDSCFSGALATRGVDAAITPSEHDEYMRKMLTKKSRNLMASGGKESVSDMGPDGHSVFAGALLNELKGIRDSSFTASHLFDEFLPEVAGRAKQTPQYSFISDSGHDAGDFVFFRTGSIPIDNGNLVIEKAPVSNPEADAITLALHRYEDAYASESVDELTRVWPTLNGQQKTKLKDLFNKMNAMKLHLDCNEPAITGEEAHVKCSQEMRYTAAGKVQPPQQNSVMVKLKKSDHGWLLDEVQANKSEQASLPH